MPRPNFTRIDSAREPGGSEVLNQHIQHTDDAFKRLGDVVQSDGAQTVRFNKADTDVKVTHQLGSVPRHVSITPTSNVTIWTTSKTDVYVILRASAAPCSASVHVY
jgi:hypothetical protein